MAEDAPRSTRRRIRPRFVVLLSLALLFVAGVWWYWSGSPRATFRVGARAYAVAFSPDGTILATGGGLTDRDPDVNGIIRLWDVANSQQVASWMTRGNVVVHLAFAPDGRTLTSLTSVRGEGPPKCEVRVWDLATNKELGSPKTIDFPKIFPITSPTGKVFARAGGRGILVMCDANTGDELYRVEADWQQLNCAAFSPDGTLIATGGGDTVSPTNSPVPGVNGDLRLWEVETGRLLATFNRHWWGPIENAAFSPDGKFVASASLDGTVKLWVVPGR